MGFDPKAALLAAKKVVEIGGDIADKTVDTVNKAKNGKIDREIRVATNKTDQVLKYIDAGEQALNTAASIYEKISKSLNATKAVENKIQESRNKFELDKKNLDNEFEKMKLDYLLEEKKSSETHEERMEKIKRFYDNEMIRIEAVKDTVIRLMELLTYLAHNDPEQMQPYVTEVSRCLSSLNFNSNNLLED